MAKPVYWLSRLNGCDLCSMDFPGGVMYDARVHGAWGNVCQKCFDADPRASLGLGRGQKYEKQPDGKWMKTDG